MTDEARHTERECHEKFAKDFFNLTWTCLSRNDMSRYPEGRGPLSRSRDSL